MVPIIKDYIAINMFSRDGGKIQAKKGIVMHSTGSPGAPAINISRYFDSLKNQDPHDKVTDWYAGAQFSVDRYRIVQSIPTDERAYHCGSPTYTAEALSLLGTYPNNTTLGIEMCLEANGSIHEDTFKNAADLVVHLITTEGWPEVLFTHKGVVGWKDCPLPWIQNQGEFERFQQAVSDRLRPPLIEIGLGQYEYLKSLLSNRDGSEIWAQDQLNQSMLSGANQKAYMTYQQVTYLYNLVKQGGGEGIWAQGLMSNIYQAMKDKHIL